MKRKKVRQEPLLSIEVDGEEVLMVFHRATRETLRAEDMIRSRGGTVTRIGERTYAGFHDPIPNYLNQRMNAIAKGGNGY